jgi:hypothetical protein
MQRTKCNLSILFSKTTADATPVTVVVAAGGGKQ